jgi:alpha-L-fucosidase
MFIHWGLYAVLGRGEWAMSRERIPWKDYRLLAKSFTAENYRPRDWARLAKANGMRYMVLTTKHHEGFCLWDSKVCRFNAVHSAAKRDLLAEFVEAARAEGLKVGLYYSLGDWLNPDWAAGWQGDEAARERFIEYTHALVRELMTGYGRIDVLWYDLPQCYSAREWRSVELNAMARSRQPQILINNRAMTTEDFATAEQHITASDQGRPWEACMTLNDSWGYTACDRNWKTPRDVALHLARVASGGGNLLLNVGPDGLGAIPEESRKILKAVGAWLERNGEAVYDVQRHRLPWWLFGPVTVRGTTLYAFLSQYHGSEITVGGLTNRVRSATLLAAGQRLAVRQRGSQTFLNGLPATSPDPVLSVVKLELDGPPDSDLSRVIGGADIFPELPK